MKLSKAWKGALGGVALLAGCSSTDYTPVPVHESELQRVSRNVVCYELLKDGFSQGIAICSDKDVTKLNYKNGFSLATGNPMSVDDAIDTGLTIHRLEPEKVRPNTTFNFDFHIGVISRPHIYFPRPRLPRPLIIVPDRPRHYGHRRGYGHGHYGHRRGHHGHGRVHGRGGVGVVITPHGGGVFLGY